MDREKLGWILRQPCHVRGIKGHTCRGRTEAHHIEQHRHDDETIPLCGRAHHEELEAWGKQTFAAHYGIESYAVIARRYHEEFLMRGRWGSLPF